MTTLRIKKGDLVKVITGAHKGKTGKVTKTDAKNQLIYVEKINVIKRHIKPSQINPRGGTKEVHKGLSAGKVALVTDAAKGTTTRISYKVDAKGNKTRVAQKTGKEIK